MVGWKSDSKRIYCYCAGVDTFFYTSTSWRVLCLLFHKVNDYMFEFNKQPHIVFLTFKKTIKDALLSSLLSQGSIKGVEIPWCGCHTPAWSPRRYAQKVPSIYLRFEIHKYL